MLPINLSRETALSDFRLLCESRHASLLGRKEVFAGKAKFGIFGDGKELAQIAMAKVFRKGDFRSGYYRDQTFMFATGELTYQQYFAQLYAHPSIEHEPASAGRMMNGHFGTRMLNTDGSWKNLMESKNVTSDISPTAGQMPRIAGLAYASKLFRNNPALHEFTQFSNKGNEVVFGTIGNASTSEGLFYETINACGVLQVPVIMSVWDDEYGISVPKEYHTTKHSISEALAGFQRTEEKAGYEILVAKGWNYTELVETYQKAEKIAREEHVPVLVHIIEITQQQGHSTSGSHERYKSKERLEWEKEWDCLKKMREWLIENNFATEAETLEIEEEAKKTAQVGKTDAWKAFVASMQDDHNEAVALLQQATNENISIAHISQELSTTINPIRADAVRAVKKALRLLAGKASATRQNLLNWLEKAQNKAFDDFNSCLHSNSSESALLVQEVKPSYSEHSKTVDGREVVQANFDYIFEHNPLVFAIGEDVGKIGDVNQGFAGLQEKYGEIRITDTGIREATIAGQGIGAAMRGLRPIIEIQYLDYIFYALQILSDDLACLQYRTRGGQKCPLIVRTRGHRLEGIWHSGSPIGALLSTLRGVHILVPRNMTQAAGFYNTMLKSDEPAVIIECLNGYRLKERLPDNVGEFTVPLGMPETLREGEDVTIVTYGSMCRVVMEASEQLAQIGIEVEVIDVQTLLPFDISHKIVESIKKTNRVIFADEDVPGGASAYMMQEVLENQSAYQYLDSKPLTIAAKAHRPPYGSDGDYFSKPNPEDIFDAVYGMMHEAEPNRFPALYV
jgi:pyruvate/2-oxoglutarate/acetoin dehydrogenase E1 component/TPP-dependent pyruvate/acetoin dehydrogenase alpha subunit